MSERGHLVGNFSRVKLNVGGQYFTTTIQTLTKDPNSMLAAMFSGKFVMQPDEDGAFFIDRDGTHFRFILNYLRTGKLTLPEGATFLKELEEEAGFYQIQGIIDALRFPKDSVALDLPVGNIFAESTILRYNEWSMSQTMQAEYRRALKGWLPADLQQVEWGLLFRASRDGFNAESFHSKCDNKGPTVIIVGGHADGGNAIFGGFTEVSWTSRGEYDTCSQAFLFSMNCGNFLGPTKMPLIKNQRQWAIYCNSTYGPTFGKGDLVIDQSHFSSDVGSTYVCPPAQYSTLMRVDKYSMDYEVFGLHQ